MVVKKRSRADFEEDEDSATTNCGMELDSLQQNTAKRLNSLTTVEIQQAKLIVADKIQTILFIDVLNLSVPEASPCPSPSPSPTPTYKLLAPSAVLPGTPSFGSIFSTSENGRNHLSYFLTPGRNQVNHNSIQISNNLTSPIINRYIRHYSINDYKFSIEANFQNGASLQPFYSNIQIEDGMSIPPVLYYTINFLMRNIDGVGIDNIFQRRGDSVKIDLMKTVLAKKGIHQAMANLTSADCLELGDLLLEHIQDISPIIPEEFHSIFKGILALNNAKSETHRIANAGIKQPTEDIVFLLRDTLLLIPIEKRHIIQWLLYFVRDLARRSASKLPITSARQLASIFGPLVTSGELKPPSSGRLQVWSVSLFELLVHANGLSEEQESKSFLFRIDSTFESEIKAKVNALKTPRRGATPRREVCNTRKSQSVGCNFNRKRRLFINKKGPAMPDVDAVMTEGCEAELNYLCSTGDNELGSPSSPLRCDRSKFSKRLRLN